MACKSLRLPWVSMAGAARNVLALVTERVVEPVVRLPMEVLHGGRLDIRNVMNEQARAGGTGLLAAFGVAGEMVTRGCVN